MDMMQYLSNPLGKGASVLMLAPMKKELDTQYFDLKSKISVKWYSLNDKYLVAHVKVPSHSVEDLFYDVLLEIDEETIPENVSIINKGNTKVFSNCPSFIYTYAKVFKESSNFIEWAGSKYEKPVLKKDPVKRNPANVISYERSLYIAIKFILSEGRNYKNRINMNVNKVKKAKDILKDVASSKDKLEEYDTKKRTIRIKEERLNKNTDTKKSEPKPSTKLPPKKGVKGVTKTNKTKKSKKTSKMKHI